MSEFRVVETNAGRFRGRRSAGVSSFLGIRYGVAPEGSGRFLPASRRSPAAGTVDALAQGPVSVQSGFRSAWLDGPFRERMGENRITATGMAEDCLVLNVWTPSDTVGEPLPIMVWIHGGTFRTGSGLDSLSTGEHLARTGRAVVVSLNHRLGLLGYLSLDHLLGDEYAQSGVVGLTDIVLALEWVRDSIAAFGGDPGNVTIFGHSGGGMKIAALLSSERTKGLIHKSIVQSPGGDLLNREQGLEQTDRALAALGLDSASAARLHELPVSAFVAAQEILDPQHHGPCPVIDGVFLPENAVVAGAGAGAEAPSNAVPMIIGATPHEISYALSAEQWYRDLSFEGLPAAAERLVPGRGAELASQYRATFPEENAALVLSRLMTDRTFGLVASAVAEWKTEQDAPVYRYEFGYSAAEEGDVLGAPHCMDLPFVFGTLDASGLAGNRPERYRLAAEMAEAWLSFAESGVPHAPEGFTWPLFVPGVAGSTAQMDADGWRATTSDRFDTHRAERIG